MLKTRLVAIVVGLALIVMGAVRPTPARATSTAEEFGIAIAAAGAWILAVAIGAWAVYGPPWSSLNQPPMPDADDPASHRAIQFGTRCAPVPGSPQPLACW